MKMLKTLLASAVVFSAMPAMAYEAGDFIVKVGAVYVSPQDYSADSSGLVADSHLQVGSNTQLGLTATYMATDHVGVELLAATPFEHTVKGEGGAIDGADIVTTKHLPPTLSLQYYPLETSSALQPYVGFGINYTFFFDEEDDGNLGTKGLEKSWGTAFSAGVNYNFNENWLGSVAVWQIDLDTKVKGGDADGLDVQIDPTVLFVSAGYKF